jgi:hypothetical protein
MLWQVHSKWLNWTAHSNRPDTVVLDSTVKEAYNWTAHSNRPDTVVLDSTVKEAYNFQPSQPSRHHHWEAPEVNGLERTAYKMVENENCMYNTITAIQNGYYPKQFRWKLFILHPALCILMEKAVIIYAVCLESIWQKNDSEVLGQWGPHWESAKLLWINEWWWWWW